MVFTAFAIASPICCKGSTSADGTAAMALVGMSWATLSAGSCTMANPPQAFTAFRPAAPSSRWPVRTTPTTRCPYCSAAERNSGSAAGRVKFSFGPRVSTVASCCKIKCLSGGAT
ncbi:hypothetical protein D3C72_1536680 [compost metagenome]